MSDEPGAGASPHPCLACGACCAIYRVDFSAYEIDEQGGQVPVGLAVEVNGNTWRMRGTDHVPIRCAALVGQVGVRASCGIYEWRPNPCRELEPGSHGCEKGARPARPAAAGRKRDALGLNYFWGLLA